VSAPALPACATLAAPPGWQTVDFLSDLHLQASDPATFDAWQRYMQRTPADAVFILGDLFEVWIGDDAAAVPGFASDCAAVLSAASLQKAVFFMHGNRDFLVGEAFMRRVGAQLLDDPTVLAYAGQRWLLSHGDALCLADTDYLQFRAQVRSPGWQQQFLARPLPERNAIARHLRSESEARKPPAAGYADVDTAAADAWLDAAEASTLIHGHTHRPAEHWLRDGRRRIVLSDWDAGATPPRLEALRLSTATGAQRVALG
jgi:UDP-2,3-diacylglucosamine hydrolase